MLTPQNTRGAGAVILDELLAGVKEAPITLIEYASFTCPHCKTFDAEVLPLIREDYIDTGKVRITYRGVYFDRRGLWADMVARCGGPESYFEITSMIYEKQDEWSAADSAVGIVENLYSIGRLAGLEQADMEVCI